MSVMDCTFNINRFDIMEIENIEATGDWERGLRDGVAATIIVAGVAGMFAVAAC